MKSGMQVSGSGSSAATAESHCAPLSAPEMGVYMTGAVLVGAGVMSDEGTAGLLRGGQERWGGRGGREERRRGSDETCRRADGAQAMWGWERGGGERWSVAFA